MSNKGDEENILEKVLQKGFPKEFEPLLNCANSNQDKFNLFTAITSTYWSENLHSNLIKAIFDCNELGTKEVISSFLEYIGCSVFKDKYWDRTPPIAYREFSTVSDDGNGRVDVLLKFNEGKEGESVVVIENKINGAQETEKQIEKYLKYFEDNKIQVLKVVFMPKVGYEEPETWPENVGKDKLVVLPAYDIGNKESLQKFFKKILQNEKLTEAQKFIFNQYIGLIDIIMSDTLSEKQTNKLKVIFDNSTQRKSLEVLFSQVDKAKEEWDCRGTLIFQELRKKLKDEKEFTYGPLGNNCLVLHKQYDKNNELYFMDNSPLIQVGYFSKDKFKTCKKVTFEKKMKSMPKEVVNNQDIEVVNGDNYKQWIFVDLSIDGYENVNKAVNAFEEIADFLLKK